MDWYLKVLKNYIGFGGRARRKEYWMFILVNIILTGVLSIIDKMLGWQRAGGEGILTTIYGVLIFLPWWAVQFRRLHDTDRSAWWLLLLLIPVIGWLVILVFNCQNGTPGNNRFGPDPKPDFLLTDAPLAKKGRIFVLSADKQLRDFPQTPRLRFAHAVAAPGHNNVDFVGIFRADNPQTPFGNILLHQRIRHGCHAQARPAAPDAYLRWC